MKFFARHKLIIVLAVVVAGVAWWGLSGSGSSPSSSLLTTQPLDPSVSPADQNLVATLLQLRAVRLEGTIFNEPTFKALQDYSTQIVPEPVGRDNPFAPLNTRTTPTAISTNAASIFTPNR